VMRSLVAFAIVLACSAIAAAQSGEENAAKADQIFLEAQKLKQQGKTAEACQKFEESLHYNSNALGTLLNVALCNEESGKYATALKYFVQTRDLARENNSAEHRKAAEEHIAKIEHLVPHLGIAFAEVATDMKLVIDDNVVGVANANDVSIDPGTHRITVSAPGRVAYQTNITVEQGKPATLTVPRLGYPVVKKTRRTVGKVITGLGAGMMVAGVVVGLVAKDKYETQFQAQATAAPHCVKADPIPMCDPKGYGETGNARTMGDVGTVVGIAGIAAFGVGAYLWFLAPSEAPERAVAIVPTFDRQSAGVAAVGHF